MYSLRSGTISFLAALVIALFGACGGDSDDGGDTSGGGGGGGGGGGTYSDYSCCINNVYYKCPSEQAMQACGDFMNPDPSGCTQQSEACPGSGGGDTGGGDTGGGDTGGGDTGGGDTGGGIGKTCSQGGDCASQLCLFKDGATYGYCTVECQSFTDCPTFWDCKEVGNGSGTYCVQ